MASLSSVIAQTLGDTPSKLVSLQLMLNAFALKPGLGGTHYVFVRGNGTSAENAAELQAAYDKAKTMPRYLGGINYNYSSSFYSGQTYYNNDELLYYKVLADFVGEEQDIVSKLEITEAEAKAVRTTLVVASGYYTFGATAFTVDTPYINIVSLTGSADVLLDGIIVSANNTYLKGLNCGVNRFSIFSDLSYLICENCVGGDFSFGATMLGNTSGTFINCIGGNRSFGGDGWSATGKFYNCKAGNYSFGDGSTASGTFNNCIGGDGAFGVNGIASGTFTNCTGGYDSFGNGGTTSGIFTNCTGGVGSFGGSGTTSGTFTNCTGGDGSFGGNGGTASGIYENCTGGVYSFGGGGTASGTFNYCEGGSDSFGGSGMEASGTFYSCKAGDSSFGGSGTTSGTFTNCTGGHNSFGTSGNASGTFETCKGGDNSFGGASGVASGTFNNCVGGAESFGGGFTGSLTGICNNCTGGGGSFAGNGGAISSVGRLYYCRLTSGAFSMPDAGGRLVLCVDGTDTIVTTAAPV